MSIICGTDFTEASAEAVTVASCLAAKMQTPLHLVHAVSAPVDGQDEAAQHALLRRLESRIEEQAAKLRPAGLRVECHLRSGVPDEVIREFAKELSAKLIVIGALGQRRSDAWQLGSHADRTAERSHIPVLVVRQAEAFADWLSGARPLRIALGVDASVSSESAGRWIMGLAEFGPCEVVLSHLYWPAEEFRRLGLGGVRSWVERDVEITRSLEREYSERFSALFGAAKVSYRLEPHLGRIGDGLAALAAKEKADLVVVGCHARGPLARVWEGSVSKHVLRCAQMSVACVPAPAQERRLVTPTTRSVLAATDFSSTGNAAIPLAYSVVNDGGTVHLVHVLEAGRDPYDPSDIFVPAASAESPARRAAHAKLTELIPKDFEGAAAITQIHILEAPHASAAICQAAERLGVDLICLGTHGRTGLSRAVLGSVASSVLGQTRRPLLLARPRAQ